MCRPRPTSQHAVIAILAALFLALSGATAGAQREAASPLRGHRLLLVSTEQDTARALAGLLAELYRAEVTIKETRRYDPGIDEYDFDGLVYFGADYFQPPKAGMLQDVERTAKPVLWIGYHGWLLDAEMLSAKGLAIFDRRQGPMVRIAASVAVEMVPKEATVATTQGAAVLYWLSDTGGERAPGALTAGSFTFVTYVPAIDPYAAEFAPLLLAIRAAFGQAPAPRSAPRPSYTVRVDRARRDRFRTGIHLPVYVAQSTATSTGYDADRWHSNLLRIREAGAEWVDLVRTHYMDDVHASTVDVDPSLTPTLESLANIVSDAHRLGLLVRLHMAINLRQRGPADWHGVIWPGDRRQWWGAFGARIRELIEFAHQHEVESVVLGTEFSSMQGDAVQWRRLIEVARREVGYAGLIGYGVNYNRLDIDWLDALDFFSISAYWPLSEDRDPELATLLRSWRAIDELLRHWTSRHPGIALEIGEIGYVSQPYASVLPFSWRAHKGEQQSLGEQLRCYEALREFLVGARYIGGVHFFASTDEDAAPGSLGYTPFGKPAEKVMRAIMRMR